MFDNEVPAEWREDLFDLIRITPNLDWLLLTKRPQNIGRMVQLHGAIAGNGLRYLPENVWLGTTVCNQEEADRNIPKLLSVPTAAVRFLSIEPMLGAVDLSMIPIRGSGHHEFDPIVTANALRRAKAYPPLPKIDWVICGGESGPKARPMNLDWVRSLRDQCSAAGVPFFFKQWGVFAPIGNTSANGVMRDFIGMAPIGIKEAGRLLDSCEHNEFPGGRS